MSDITQATAAELRSVLGASLRQRRLFRNLDQRSVAERADISLRALRKLEQGQGSNVETLLRVLKVLDALHIIEQISPEVSVSPMAMLRGAAPPRRVRRSIARTASPPKV
jgi:transcriptional regulator with XRE-family HTH domain